jgi:hypothetical protein
VTVHQALVSLRMRWVAAVVATNVGHLGSDDEPAGDVDGGAAGGGGDGGPGGVVPSKSAFLDLQRESDNVKLMRHYLAESLNIYSFVNFPIVDGAGAIVDEKTFQTLGPPFIVLVQTDGHGAYPL